MKETKIVKQYEYSRKQTKVIEDEIISATKRKKWNRY